MLHPPLKRNDQLRKAVAEYIAFGTSIHGPISGWDVSRITDMSRLFALKKRFTADLSRWDTSNVTDMTDMFWGAKSFTSDLSGWDVSNVTDMSGMFWGATKFTSDLSRWSTTQAATCKMFCNATSFLPRLITPPSGLGWTGPSLARHRARWRWVRVRILFCKVRPMLFFWIECAAVASYGPNGTGRKRDRQAFEVDCAAFAHVT